MTQTTVTSPQFGPDFQTQLLELLRWRRDVRRFRSDPVPEEAINGLLEAANLAPSVGLSQPWRFVSVRSPDLRREIEENFRRCNRDALSDYAEEEVRIYASLKLSGLGEAPVHFAVYCDEGTSQGRGLGRKTMPETLRYSTVAAIQNLWLTARARGIGVGWVSILDPEQVSKTLQTPEGWRFVAYLCVGYPEEEHLDPELERHKWEKRKDFRANLLTR